VHLKAYCSRGLQPSRRAGYGNVVDPSGREETGAERENAIVRCRVRAKGCCRASAHSRRRQCHGSGEAAGWGDCDRARARARALGPPAHVDTPRRRGNAETGGGGRVHRERDGGGLLNGARDSGNSNRDRSRRG
jgi:hypothetical protein